MIKIQNVIIPIQEDRSPIEIIAETLKTNISNIKTAKLIKRAIDARKKPNIFYCDTYLVEMHSPAIEKNIVKKFKNADFYTPKTYIWKKAYNTPNTNTIIVGSGPAGLFAALTLARAGIKPIIIEQGEPVEQRIKTVEAFWNNGKLKEKSNVQFGEGGAGTFSDGKLNTGIKDIRCRTVLEEFNRFGANEDILINAKPHIGTDVLRDVVKNIRKEIESLGGKYYFNTEFIKPIIKNNKITSVILKSEKEEYELPCENLILAIGNASRKTYRSLYANGLNIIPKPFAIGVRIEHLQENINHSRYSKDNSNLLPAADYKLATHLPNGRGVYTFCMCPGGVVVNSASENNTYVTNGMSYQSRNGCNANSALLVGVTENDFEHLEIGTPFGGVVLQETIERKAFEITKGQGAPIQNVGNFLNKSTSNIVTNVSPTIKPTFCNIDLDLIFPQYITESLKLALPIFDKQIKGFADDSAILTAPETRSSSPVRILRNDNYLSNIDGIFPCGEGAGYAGGITSSAVDGIKVAEAIIENINNK
jgi:uncharacterized FAD-dependent dehydrogenase